MKNVFLLLIITFSLLIVSNVESKGQCPTGYTPQTITLNIGGCNYDISVCVSCPSPTSHFPNEGSIIIGEIVEQVTIPPCNNGWTEEQIINYVKNYMDTGQFMWYFSCFWSEIPPCPKESILFHVLWSNCWRAYQTTWDSSPTRGMQPCGESYCRSYYTYCQHGGMLKIVYQQNIKEGPDPTCPPFNQVPYGACFKVDTPCNYK